MKSFFSPEASGRFAVARGWFVLLLFLTTLATSPRANAAGFISAAPLAQARYAHTASMLPSGKLLVAGGFGPLASVEIYDRASDAWTAAASMSTARYSHTATVLPSGKVLVAGGTSGNTRLASAELYDPVSNSWSPAGSLATARVYHFAVLLPSGKVLVAGGLGNSELASAELYDPASNTWSSAGNMGAARDSPSASLLQSGKVLVAGGYASGWLASAELYDPSSNSWSAAGPLGTARWSHAAVVLASGKVLVSGGSAQAILASSEIYDPATNAWTATAPLTIARSLHAEILLPSGNVLVTGGISNAGAPTAAELYDPDTGAWASAGNLLVGRSDNTSTLLSSGEVILVGGSNLQILSSVELYSPATQTSVSAISPPTTVVGESYTVSFSVASASAAPTGSVVVSDDIGNACGPVQLVGGSGGCALTSTSSGNRVVTVAYTSNSGAFADSNDAVAHAVDRADSMLSIVGDTPDPSLPGQQITVTVGFGVVGPGAGSPTGALTVSDGVDGCTIPVGATACQLTLTTRGPRVLVAAYAGDGNFNPSSAQATHAVNRLPLVDAAGYSAFEDVALTVAAAQGLLAGASDPDGDVLTIANPGSLVASGIGGEVTLNADGSFLYMPPADANGQAIFDYQVSDGLETLSATATITVAAVNDAPSFSLAPVPGWPAGSAGARTQVGFANVTRLGPPDEAGQHMQAWIVRPIADPNHVAADVAIGLDGTLGYTLSGNAGSATFGVKLQDDGGTADGGTDTAPEQTFVITVMAGLDLSISVDDGRAFAQGGLPIDYTVVVRNAGPNDAVGARVRDLLPANLVGAVWTCSAQGNAACAASGSGDIDDVVDLPNGATLRYELSATVLADPEVAIENTVSVTPPEAVPDSAPANNSATDTDAVGIFADGFDAAMPAKQPVGGLATGGTHSVELMDAGGDAGTDSPNAGAIADVCEIDGDEVLVQRRGAIDGAARIRLALRGDSGGFLFSAWAPVADKLSLEWTRDADSLRIERVRLIWQEEAILQISPP